MNDAELLHYQGIKFNSIYNELQFYHVCNPGLPPCLGHDLFEGVLQYDLALFLSYLVKVQKWFTFDFLNQAIAKFRYRGSDSNDKPNTISDKGKKLGGHAVWRMQYIFFVLFHYSYIQKYKILVMKFGWQYYWACMCSQNNTCPGWPFES